MERPHLPTLLPALGLGSFDLNLFLLQLPLPPSSTTLRHSTRYVQLVDHCPLPQGTLLLRLELRGHHCNLALTMSALDRGTGYLRSRQLLLARSQLPQHT